jgi:hypothetical protein
MKGCSSFEIVCFLSFPCVQRLAIGCANSFRGRVVLEGSAVGMEMGHAQK